MNQASTNAKNTARLSGENIRRKTLRLPSTTANTSNTASGTRNPTGPLVSVAVAAATALANHHIRRAPPEFCSATYAANSDVQIASVSAMSKITIRASPRNIGAVASTTAASAAVRHPYTRRQNADTITSSATPNTADGSRAANSVRPNTASEIATVRK